MAQKYETLAVQQNSFGGKSLILFEKHRSPCERAQFTFYTTQNLLHYHFNWTEHTSPTTVSSAGRQKKK